MTDTKTLLATLTARTGQADGVGRILSAYAEAVRREPGNLVFTVYREDMRPERFVVYEIYADQAAFDAHIADPQNVEVNTALAPLIEGAGSELTFLVPVG